MRVRAVDVEHVNGTFTDGTTSIDALRIVLDEPLEGRFVGFTDRFPNCPAFARVLSLPLDGRESRRSITITAVVDDVVSALNRLRSAQHQPGPGCREICQ